MFPLLLSLPLEVLNILISFLKPEDILVLGSCLPSVQDCPVYKKLVGKTIRYSRMWDKFSHYKELHEDCIHICLPKVTKNPFNESDDYLQREDSFSCSFLGKGIFCYPINEDRGEDLSRYEKQVVPLKKHIHCNCAENKLVPCAVHEHVEDYKESTSFAKRGWKNCGYEEIQSITQLACHKTLAS